MSLNSALLQPDLAWFPRLLFFTHKLDLHPRTKNIVIILPNKTKHRIVFYVIIVGLLKKVNKKHCTALKYHTIEYL